jgi:hypothetical protein
MVHVYRALPVTSVFAHQSKLICTIPQSVSAHCHQHSSLAHTPGATGNPGPAYWGFTVAANLLPLMASTLHAAKMIAVFDIDETLLMAHTVDSLSARLNRIRVERWV